MVYDGCDLLRQSTRGYVSAAALPHSVAKAAPSLASVNLIGAVVASGTYTKGMYKISLDGTLTPLCTTANKCPTPTHGGVAVDGTYYSGWQYDFYGMMIDYIDGYDMETWSQTVHKQLSNKNMFASDLSLDPVSGKVYGCYFNDAADGFVFGTGDYKTFTRTPVCELVNQWNSVAFAKDGTLYAIDMAGDLLKVDKTNGATTKVGSTGIVPLYVSGAVIDPKTGLMIWSVFGEDAVGRLYQVDVTNAQATLLCEFPENTEIAGLTIIAPLAEDDAPAAVTNVVLDFPNGTMTGTVNFDTPSTLFNGEAATGELTYKVLANGDEVSAGATTFGASVKAPVTIATAGNYEFTVTVANAAGPSPAVKAEAYVGTGTPAATKATLALAAGKLNLSWTAVTETVDGGYIDPAQVRYTVVRFPGEVVVADKIAETTFSEAAPEVEELTSFYYTVTVHSGDKVSTAARSNTVSLGSVEPPYASSFNLSTGLDGYTILDVNGDGKIWKLDDKRAYLPYDSKNAADDWLITPGLKLKKGYTYRFDFVLSTKSGAYMERIEIKWGREATPAGMTDVILEPYEFKSIAAVNFEEYITPTEDGVYYIGFHGISDKYMYGVYVDKFSLGEGTNLSAPAEATDIEVIPDYDGATKATIKFKAPAVNINGDAITSLTEVEVLRGEEVVKTFTAPAPGAELQFVDTPDKSGNYTYTIIASNESGKGTAASVTKFVGINKPGMVTDVVAVETEKDGEVKVTWKAPEVDADGYPMNPALMTYSVYEYTAAGKVVEIAGGQNLKTTEFTFQAVGADEEQEIKEWAVFAVTAGGNSTGVRSGLIVVGPDYTMPYIESVADGKLSYNHTIDQFNGGVWRPYNGETMPSVTSADGDNGLFGMRANDKGTYGSLITGKLKISGEKPGAMFWLYNAYENGAPVDENVFNLYVRTKAGVETKVKTLVIKDLEKEGWNRVVVPLDAFKGQTVYLSFEGVCNNVQYMFLDNVRVLNLTDNNLAAVAIKAPAKVDAGKEFNLAVTVDNRGLNDVKDYTVALYYNGAKVASAAGNELASGMKADVAVAHTMTVLDGETGDYYATIEFAADEDLADNATAHVEVANVLPNHPAPETLTATSVGTGVNLTWKAPVMGVAAEPVVENFEDAGSFSRELAGWTFVDVDGKPVGGLSVPLPGITQKEPASWFVFDNAGDSYNSTFDAQSGTKFLAALVNYNYYEPVDDWAISPKLSGEAQTISFYAKSYNGSFKESFEVLYSTGSLDPNDFVSVLKKENIVKDWTKYTAELPEGALYFAIRCISVNAYMIMVDDVKYTPAAAGDGLELVGYNVYRDGEKLNSEPVATTEYVDAEAPEGNHTYAVTAVYTAGESKPVTADANHAGIDEIGSDGITVTAGQGYIEIAGAQGQTITVYTVDGRTAATATATANTRLPLTPAVYIVKVAGQTAKVAVK